MTEGLGGNGTQDEARTRRILTDISPRSWEHPR